MVLFSAMTSRGLVAGYKYLECGLYLMKVLAIISKKKTDILLLSRSVIYFTYTVNEHE
jgi:hypothetical protein